MRAAFQIALASLAVGAVGLGLARHELRRTFDAVIAEATSAPATPMPVASGFVFDGDTAEQLKNGPAFGGTMKWENGQLAQFGGSSPGTEPVGMSAAGVEPVGDDPASDWGNAGE